MLLVGDLGGTHARLALSDGGALTGLRRFRAEAHPGVEAVLRDYLADMGQPSLDAACLAVAGPVSAGRAVLTNRGWTIDAEAIARQTGAGEVRLMNDLVALGHATASLTPRVLRAGAGPGNGQSLVVNAGTGFNTCTVVAHPGGRLCLEAEAGHSALPAPVAAALGPLAAGFETIEALFAGTGLARLHARRCGGELREGAELAASRDDPEAAASLSLYAGLFGCVLRELAHLHLPRDGIWLAGGVARALMPRSDELIAGFLAPPRLRELAEKIPLLLIEDDMAGLRGCLNAIAR